MSVPEPSAPLGKLQPSHHIELLGHIIPRDLMLVASRKKGHNGGRQMESSENESSRINEGRVAQRTNECHVWIGCVVAILPKAMSPRPPGENR